MPLSSLKNLVPSRLIAPLVPAFLSQRFGVTIDKGLSNADRIWVGDDETALSLRTALFTFTIRIISAFIAYVSQILIARWLGAHEYGVFVWVWVAAVICGGFSCLGFPSAVVRFIPQYRLAQEHSLLQGIIFGSRCYAIGATSCIALIAIGLIYAYEDVVSNAYIMPLFLGVFCLPMLALAEVQDGIARAFNWMDIALSATYLVRPSLILLAMVIALLAGMEANASTALIASIIATWLTSIGQLLFLNRRLKRTISTVPKKLKPKLWISVAIPIFLVEGFFTLLTNVDIMIVGWLLSPHEVAVYFAAVKTLALVHFVYFAVKASAAHRYSQYHAAGDKLKYEEFIHATTRWTFWPSLAIGLLLALIGPYLLMLFGDDFTSGYPILLILLIGVIARSTIGPAESVLNMSGQQNICASVYAITLFVNVALNLSLIPHYGLYGAAWATTIAMIFESFALYALILRRLNIHMFCLNNFQISKIFSKEI